MPDPDRDALVVAAARTPVTKAHKGMLSSVRPDDLASYVTRELLAAVGDPIVDEVVVGCGYPWGEQGYNVARAISLLAGLPVTTPATTVTRLCASSLQALRMAHHAIAIGEADSVLVVGVESFSRVGRDRHLAEPNPRLDGRAPLDLDYYVTMLETAERVAKVYGVSRHDMDTYAQQSQTRALAAQGSGFFDAEIVPVHLLDGTTVAADDGPRSASTLEGLLALPAVLGDGGLVTAGNSCPLNDGAAALLVVSARYARANGLTSRARIVGSSVVGVDPGLMGIGPIGATTRLFERTGHAITDIDSIELNEAFAAQVIPSAIGLGIDPGDDRFNPHGGAIALGHPFGMTGARMVTTLINSLETGDGELGLATLCVGGGQGQSLLLESVG